MAASAHLLRSLGVELGNPPTNRCKPTSETRKHPDSDPENPRDHTKISSPSESRSRAAKATTNLENLGTRIKILRGELESLRARLAPLFDAVYKVPPDPGPAFSPSTNIEVVLREREEDAAQMPGEFKKILSSTQSFTGSQGFAEKEEESIDPLPGEVKDLQVFSASNSRDELVSYSNDGTSFKRSRISPQIRPVPIRPQNHSFLQARCLRNWSFAKKGNNSKNSMTSEECAIQSGGVMAAGARASPVTAGKEVAESSSAAEKRVLVVHTAGASKSPHSRFVAVGFLRSVLLVNSRHLIDHMKKVWRLRGEMDASPVKAEVGRKFILEFSVEGDWKHVIMGGPWQYKGDAFLVEGITAGTNPSAALFTHVPMWVQFRNIPFYLLSKKLARDLGESIGTTMRIDSNARGPMNKKFLRTRVLLPLFSALRKEIVLVDDITGEEFAVHIRYERLPNFCLFCGYIGHVDENCDLPIEEKKINFSLDLCVPPVHFDDPRRWELPEPRGQSHQSSSSKLWRAPKPEVSDCPALCHLAAIAQDPTTVNKKAVDLVEKVARLTVEDNHKLVDTGMPETGTRKNLGDAVIEDNEARPGGVHSPDAIDTAKGDGKEMPGNKQGNQIAKAINSLNSHSTAGSTSDIKMKSWKRRERNVSEVQSNTSANLQGAGVVRSRTETCDEYDDMEPKAKKGAFRGPTLSECFGEEGLAKLRAAEQNEVQAIIGNEGKDISTSVGKITMEGQGGAEAVGPGATGTLSGANDSARQEP